MKKYSYLAGAAFLAVATSSSFASITLVATPTPTSGAGAINQTLINDGWVGYTLTLVADGTVSTGVDAVDFHNVVTAQPGMPQSNIGISGEIHQAWVINNNGGGGADVATPLGTLPFASQGQTRDSFWVAGGNGFVSETNAPAEDNNKANGGTATDHTASPLADLPGTTTGSTPTNGVDFGVGSLMTFAGAYNTPFTGTVTLGFIIVPSSVPTTINGVAVDSNPTPVDWAISTVLGGGPTTPEPASVGLVGLGALSLLARRRRKV